MPALKPLIQHSLHKASMPNWKDGPNYCRRQWVWSDEEVQTYTLCLRCMRLGHETSCTAPGLGGVGEGGADGEDKDGGGAGGGDKGGAEGDVGGEDAGLADAEGAGLAGQPFEPKNGALQP